MEIKLLVERDSVLVQCNAKDIALDPKVCAYPAEAHSFINLIHILLL
jgi:hypothetical protein